MFRVAALLSTDTSSSSSSSLEVKGQPASYGAVSGESEIKPKPSPAELAARKEVRRGLQPTPVCFSVPIAQEFEAELMKELDKIDAHYKLVRTAVLHLSLSVPL